MREDHEDQGHPLDGLEPKLYDELRSLARSLMQRERPDHTLQTTALVNEACLRLLGASHLDWSDQRAFMYLAARSMRRVLVDYARQRKAGKRWGELERVPLEEIESEAASFLGYPRLEMLNLDEALNRLADAHERKAHIVELLYFAGLTLQQTADVLGLSRRTVDRDWRYARLWLIREMEHTRDQPAT